MYGGSRMAIWIPSQLQSGGIKLVGTSSRPGHPDQAYIARTKRDTPYGVSLKKSGLTVC